jgi:hypothetical protein
MKRYESTFDFIHICQKSRKERFSVLARQIGVKKKSLDLEMLRICFIVNGIIITTVCHHISPFDLIAIRRL